MKISIIAPNLNEAKYLPTFLSSLDHQTFKDFELIIIDGGSKDESLSIIASFMANLRIKVIINTRRNIGYVRNIGAWTANGELMFHTSSDTYHEPQLLQKIVDYFEQHKDCVALTGRTFPLGTSIFSHLSYHGFDLLRWFFTRIKFPARKFRPSGSFFVIKKKVFDKVGGFPNVQINEDGLLGQKLDLYCILHGCNGAFCLDLFIGHHAKRFEARGGLTTILFYIYVLGNMFPLLKPFFNHIERRSAEAFATRSDLGGDL